jgi:hypothetical protein
MQRRLFDRRKRCLRSDARRDAHRSPLRQSKVQRSEVFSAADLFAPPLTNTVSAQPSLSSAVNVPFFHFFIFSFPPFFVYRFENGYGRVTPNRSDRFAATQCELHSSPIFV